MRTLKTIRIFYIVYSVYALFVAMVSDYKPRYYIVGISVLWLTYGLYSLGVKSSKKTDSRRFSAEAASYNEVPFPFSNIENWGVFQCLLALFVAWASAVLASRFYTGRDFISILTGIFGGNAAYYSYQMYFTNNRLDVFSIRKIPYILMLAYLTIIFIWSTLGIVLGKTKQRWWKKAYLFGVVLAYLFFGIARGTNYETYVVFIVIAYCLLNKAKSGNRINSFKYLFLVGIAGIIMIFIFRARLMDRGVKFVNEICPEIFFDDSSFFALFFPTLTNIGLSVFGYLGYGVYCIGVTIVDIILGSVPDMILSFLPCGFPLFKGESLSIVLSHFIDMGVKWAPDYVFIVNYTGIFAYCFVPFILGRFSQKADNMEINYLLKKILQVIVFIEMLSIPVGNFLIASSANILMILFAFLWWIQSSIFRIRVITRSPKKL